jgi:hypothetical protein
MNAQNNATVSRAADGAADRARLKRDEICAGLLIDQPVRQPLLSPRPAGKVFQPGIAIPAGDAAGIHAVTAGLGRASVAIRPTR